MEHVMIRGMNKEKTSKGMIVGAYGRMIDIAVETKEKNILKNALVIAAARDDAWRRSAIDVDYNKIIRVKSHHPCRSLCPCGNRHTKTLQ
jgi:hypothetical protein